jgi:hypothetical protein
VNYTLVAAAENAGRARHQSEDALPSAEEALARGRPLLESWPPDCSQLAFEPCLCEPKSRFPGNRIL